MKQTLTLIAAPLLLSLAACSSDSNYNFEASKEALDAKLAATTAPQALFSTSAPQAIPFPSNLLFLGSADGNLNIPIADTADQTLANPQVALNQQDGFSTTSPIVTGISESLDPASLRLGDTVRVYEVNVQQGYAVTGIVSEVTNDPQPQLAVSEVDKQLLLVPLVPLKPKTNYLVVLTNGITDTKGNALTASFSYNLLKGETVIADPSAEGLRQAVQSHLAAVQGAAGIEAGNVALSWVFTTQSIREVLQAVKNQSTASALALGSAGASTAMEAIGGAGYADLYVGQLAVPYYQTALSESNDATAVLNGFWKNANQQVVGAINAASGARDYTPVATTTETIPVIMTVPNDTAPGYSGMPGDGWPVTLFQHGITGNRTQMLALADAMAAAGRVLIAIDMPMHGLTDTSNPFHADNTELLNERERTFGIDIGTNSEDNRTASAADGPDGKPDPSGLYFYNLRNLANSRDNLRQAIGDLFVLSASIGSAQVEGVSLNANNLSFVGHSLGGIVGSTVLSFDNSYKAATLAMPGGGIAQLLANSESFGPTITAGLASAGIEAGSAAYQQFLTAAQTMIDSADPINHATTLAAEGSAGLHMIQVNGDTVVPNNVAVAPLSGTEPLARLMGLTQVDESSAVNSLVKFTAGDHGSIVRPTGSEAAFAEMQKQSAGFAASQGTLLPITDTSVIENVE